MMMLTMRLPKMCCPTKIVQTYLRISSDLRFRSIEKAGDSGEIIACDEREMLQEHEVTGRQAHAYMKDGNFVQYHLIVDGSA